MPSMQSSHWDPLLPTLAEKLSDSPLTDQSSREQSVSTNISFCVSLDCELRVSLYKQVGECVVSERMSRRGVSWLLTVSWSRGFDQPCVWTTLLLYYAYKTRFPFGKEEIEAILLVCLQLSSKFHQSAPLQTRDLLLLLNRPISREDLRMYEERILLITDFNLIIPHYLDCLDAGLDSEVASKVHFICELLLFKHHNIFFDKDKIERLARMVQGSFGEISEDEATEIRELMNEKQSRILHHKYGDRFDTDIFVSSFCEIC